MRYVAYLLLAFSLAGCFSMPMVPPPKWNANNDVLESEYTPYIIPGTATVSGQAFLTQAGGGVVKAAGRNVTLDPATTIGNEWWGKAGKHWIHRSLIPPSPGFVRARRTVVADADGRFKFTDLPAGKYFVRTEVTWEVGGYIPTQGGLVGQLIEVGNGKSKEVILNQYPE